MNQMNWFERRFLPGSVKATTFTLLSATLGVGMLSMPRAFYKSGTLLCTLLMYLAALVSYQSIICLVKVSYKTKLTTYSDMALWSYGTKFKVLTDLIYFLNTFGSAVTYSIVIKENLASGCEMIASLFYSGMPKILQEQKNVFWIIVSQGILIPLVLKEKLTELRIFSLISFCIIIYIAMVIITNCFREEYTNTIDPRLDEVKYVDFSGFTVSLPIFIFGFTCQQNILSCYREMITPTMRRIRKVITRQIFISSSIYLMVGIFGYLTFGNHFSPTEQNILTKYSAKNVPVFIVAAVDQATIILIFSITFIQPLNILPAREVLFIWLRPGSKPRGGTYRLLALSTLR